PSLRGVPSSVNYGTTQHHTSTTSNTTVSARPAQVQHNPHPPQQSPNPPPIPSNPPPESRVPASVRSAVSPRRATKSPRQWPPDRGLPTLRYWQIDPASQSRKEKENEPVSLHEMVEATDNEDVKRTRKGRARKDPESTPQVAYSKTFGRKSERKEISVDVEIKATNSEAVSTALTSKPAISSGIHWTVIHAPNSPELRAQYPRDESPTIERPLKLPESPDLVVTHPSHGKSSHAAPFDKTNTLFPPHTTDTSTSPIPTIQLPRRRSGTGEPSGILRALSPVPFRRVSPPVLPTAPHEPLPELAVDISTQDHHHPTLVGANTTPRPFSIQNLSPSPVPTVEEKPKRSKVLKKVDFSKATVIPELWQSTSEVIDEEEISADLSPTDSLPFTPPADKEMSSNATTPYDGDESETYDNKSDNASTLEMELVDEQEQWIREELELAQKEELAKLGIPLRTTTDSDNKEEWRQQAMALLNDDTQMERDIAIVAALNERLQGLKGMEEEDRQKAIDCIRRHQNNLEEQQDQLSALLDSAIAFLKNLDTSPSTMASKVPFPEQESPTPPEVKVDDLCDVLEELENTPGRFKGPGDLIAEKLERIRADDGEVPEPPLDVPISLLYPILGQSYTRSTFEQHTEQRTTTGPGGAPAAAAKPLESRGHGSLNNPGGRIPYCESCKQQIRGAFVLATGLAWCPEHFVCAYRGCGRRLLECGFVEESGSKYCEGCFEAHIAPRCAKCAKPIISVGLNFTSP
ncbi:LIM domain protein, partial [Cooperia oncophora]